MLRYLLIAFLFSFQLRAQDKLFFKDGSMKQGQLVSIGKEIIYFKTSDTSDLIKLNKSELVLIETYSGRRYLFAEGQAGNTSVPLHGEGETFKRNYFGMQPVELLVGRVTFVFERMDKNNKIGFVVPFSLTFDPFGILYRTQLDSNKNTIKHVDGVKFITGVDVNFYPGKVRTARFFIGPRFRYGTDMFLNNIEAFTLQTQIGWKMQRSVSKIAHHISVGFGFVRIISSPLGRLINAKQSNAWFSVNYRLGLNW